MDAANVYGPCSITYVRESAPLPFGGHEASQTNLASRGLPYGPGALATTPEASSSVSDDSCAGDSSYSSSCPEMRYGKAILGPGYFTRDDFLDYYGHNGIARWERATVYDSDDNADGSNDGADIAGGSDENDDAAVGPHDDADYADGSGTDPHASGEAPAAASALPFAAPPTTEPVSSAIGASVASRGVGRARRRRSREGPRSLVGFGSSAGSAKPPCGPPRGRPRALARTGVPRRQPSASARSGRPCTWRWRGWCDGPERSFCGRYPPRGSRALAASGGPF